MQLVATTRDNVSPSFVLEFLKRISIIIKVHAAVGVAGLLRGAESSRSVCQPGTPCIRQPNSTACSGCSGVSASPQACLHPPQRIVMVASPFVVPRAGLLWQRE